MKSVTDGITVSTLKPAGQFGKLATRAGCLCYSLEAEFLLPQKPSHFASLEPSTDEMQPTHIMKGNLLKVSTHRCDSHPRHNFMVTSRLVFDQTTGTRAQPRGHMKFTITGTLNLPSLFRKGCLCNLSMTSCILRTRLRPLDSHWGRF